MESEKEKEDELKTTIIEAIRPARKGELENLLASNLAAAIFSPPMQKIRLILEAFLLIPDEEKINLVKPEEIFEFEKLYEVCISFINHLKFVRYDNEFVLVPWSFPLEKANEYLKLFLRRVFYCNWKDWDWNEFDKEMKEKPQETFDLYLKALAEYLSSGFAPFSLFKFIENEFIINVMPKALELLRSIFEKYITIETWENTLALFSAKKGESETWK